MELSSRQIVALGAPLVVTYLTWSTVGGQTKTLEQSSAAAVATAAAAKRPDIGALVRNPFAPVSDAGGIDSDVLGEDGTGGADPANRPLHLDGTVIAGGWRMAIINGQRVFKGQAYRGGYRLTEVTTDAVTLVGPSGEIRLTLDIAPAAVPAAARAKPGAPGRQAKAGSAGQANPGAAQASSATASAKREPAALERGLEVLKGGTEANGREATAPRR